MKRLKSEVTECLVQNILPYWLRLQDEEHGGFYGEVTGSEVPVPTADRGAILYARILWAFSAAYRVLHKTEYLRAATRAKDYILAHFIDHEYGGTYWSVDYLGNPKDTKKQFYAIGFMIYGFSEYVRATGDPTALQTAISLYHCIEEYSLDTVHNGYIEATTRDWQPIADMRLSEKDENQAKSQNSHLHIIEPYANLYRVWQDEGLKKAISNLLHLFDDVMRDKQTNHINLFFDMEWHCTKALSQGPKESYGHDIEASWLIDEAATLIGEPHNDFVFSVAKAASEGLNADGSMRHEDTDPDIHWWVMAETVVGYANIYQRLTEQPDATHHIDEILLNRRRTYEAWEYIKTHLVDHQHGEWYWSCSPDGKPNTTDDKAGFWKCPYHNSRMCLEIIQRF